ncbi:sigma-70 family RNA polymerase sigma factor [Dactylosporangium sp. NPDC000244]|uniref:sigma-70 family RNA polymerase sigma factor n=1 Tax=Dactylosporangium sp. NPDC000244 TaxID=3154365 RepID=UPI00331720B9
MTFEEFLVAELPGLTRFAGALTGDRDLGEDILADALLTVSAKWARISGTQRPLAYVRRVVVTTFLSDRRRAARRRTQPVGDPSLLDRAEPDVSDVVARRDFVAQLLTALPAQQRAAVVLRYLLDQTDDEIAQTLRCSTGTVRSHLSRARATLRMTAPAERS